MEDWEPYRQEAVRVAQEAGALLRHYYRRLEGVELKGIGDPITEADRASEQQIRKELQRAFPGVPVYGEEYGFEQGPSQDAWERCWIVDPLDGTANFACGVPIFAVSIALLDRGSPVVGVVYDPLREECFTAARGQGARRNGRPIRPNRYPPTDGMAQIGVSADTIRHRPEFFRRILKGRSLGSAALQLVYVAAGHFAAAMDPLTKLWDVAAGAVILAEAGGVATHWDGSPLFPLDPQDPTPFQGRPFDYLASNGVDHPLLVEWTRSAPPIQPLNPPVSPGTG
ncbi:MAG: inositol monophosphatase [Candidatus Poribacteria bacterium]|nr:MAG: inositol monophosphatase [Candidatus Poribacteria bacterium]